MVRKPPQEHLGISETTLQKALAAIEAGAPVRDVVERLRLSGAERERARVFFSNRRRRIRDLKANAYGDSLNELTEARTAEVYARAVNAINQSIKDQQALINQFTVLEGEGDTLAEQLAVLDHQVRKLLGLKIDPSSRPSVVNARERLTSKIRTKYAEMLAVLDRMHAVSRRITDASDIGLLSAGFKPSEVVEIGGLSRDSRTLYRRKKEQPEVDPDAIDFAVDPYFTGILRLLTKFEILERAARETIRVRLARLDQRISPPETSGNLQQVRGVATEEEPTGSG